MNIVLFVTIGFIITKDETNGINQIQNVKTFKEAC